MASGGQRRDLPRANSSGDEKVLDQPKATTMKRVAVEPRYMKSTVAQSVRSRPPSGAAAAMGATSADKATVGKVTKELSSQKDVNQPSQKKSLATPSTKGADKTTTSKVMKGSSSSRRSTKDDAKHQETKKKAAAPGRSVAVPSEGIRSAVWNAQYWRGIYKLITQREKFEEERKKLVAELEGVTNDRAEIIRRAHVYKSLSDEIVGLQKALELVNAQMPSLTQSSAKSSDLQKKLELFTSALNQFLSCLMTVDTKTVDIPKTDKGLGNLAIAVDAVNTDLAKLIQSLGLADEEQENSGSVASAAHHLLEATNLLFVAYEAIEKNKALLNKVEEKKIEEDFDRAYLSQLQRIDSLLDPYGS